MIGNKGRSTVRLTKDLNMNRSAPMARTEKRLQRLAASTRALSSMLVAILGLLVAIPASPAAEDGKQPNIIFIMADDLGYGALGCYGQTKIKTPNIDRLAAEGMRFTQAYSGSHVCQPARSVLMTGLHAGHTPCRANSVSMLLREEDVTVAEVLQDQGYTTGLFGKWGLGFEGTSGHPLTQGFDRFYGQLMQVHAHFYYPAWICENEERVELPGNVGKRRGQYVPDLIHEKAMEFIRDNKEGPFFAYLPYIIPHVELVVPEESEEPYRGEFPKIAIMDPRRGYIGSEDGLTTVAGMISRMDGHVGEIMALLEELEIDDNTLVIFTSDNGGQSGGKDQGWTKMTDYFQANGLLRGYKGQFYEGGIRVPMVARLPGVIEAGTTSDHLCGFFDVLPTLAEVGGGDSPKEIDGISIWPTLSGQGTQEIHEALYWEYPRRDDLQRAARAGKWKIVQMSREDPAELFDLEADPSEKNNIAGDHPDVVERLTRFMDDAHESPRDYPAIEMKNSIDKYIY